MSMGLWRGAVPSSLMVPVIFPSEAALTFFPGYRNPTARTSKAELITAILCPAFIESTSSLRLAPRECSLIAEELPPAQGHSDRLASDRVASRSAFPLCSWAEGYADKAPGPMLLLA